MTQSPVPPGGAKETGKVNGPEPGDGDWRKALRCHADTLWRGRPADSNLAAGLSQSLGPLADDARTIVEAYALGARKAGGAPADPPAEFAARLDLILGGIDSALGAAAPGQPAPPARPQVIQSELWQLLRKVRESAELS